MPLIHRIDKADLAQYQARRLTARYLAEKYGTTVSYIYQSIERQPPPPPQAKNKTDLLRLRRQHRDNIARQVPPLSGREAAKMCHCSERTMWRHVKRVRAADGLPPLDEACFNTKAT